MNDELRKMSEAAGIEWWYGPLDNDEGEKAAFDARLEAFARLVAADCANMVADIDDGEPVRWMAEKCADIIRAKYGIKP